MARQVACALAEAAKQHPRATPRLLVLDRDAQAQVRAAPLDVQPACEWLLAARDDE